MEAIGLSPLNHLTITPYNFKKQPLTTPPPKTHFFTSSFSSPHLPPLITRPIYGIRQKVRAFSTSFFLFLLRKICETGAYCFLVNWVSCKFQELECYKNASS